MTNRSSRTLLAALFALAAAGGGCTPDGAPRRRLAPRPPVDGGPGALDGGAPDSGSPSPGDDGGAGPADGGFVAPPDARRVTVDQDSCPEDTAPLSVPVLVRDQGNAVARDPATTGFLVPLAESSGVRSLDVLVVRDERGARLPAQFEALSRWNGHPGDCARPLRFVFAHVRAVPPPGGTARWRVEVSPGHDGELTTLTLDERADAWVIDTGAARFTVRRDRFAGLSRVELPDGKGGFDLVSDLGAAAGFFLDHGGVKHSAARAPTSLALERRGPQRVTVAARGFYAASAGERDLGYTVRLHFDAGSTVVRVEHTYYHGAVEGWGADGATNTTRIERAWMSVPLAAPAESVVARALDRVVTAGGGDAVQLEQEKRTPAAPAPRFTLRAAGAVTEQGPRARRPYVAASGGGVHVGATVARLAERDPQGLRWNPASRAVEVDFTSGPLQVGGARGIWGVAALDFGRGAPDPARFDVVRLAAERPLLGVPEVEYLNGTRTLGPYAARTDGPAARWFTLMDEIHGRTRDYLEEFNVTGLQLWPDLPRDACYINVNCDAARRSLHEGGDNNYWNWSKVGIDEFFRTGDNAYLHDFSLGEAVTFVETLAFRTDPDRVSDSSVAGLAACYGDSRGYDGDYREGLNNRRDRCVADYTYDKTLKLAFLATGDARFVDYFEDAGESVINAFGAPWPEPDPFLELNLNRLSEQRLELLSSAAEFGRDPARSGLARERLRTYVDHMLGRTLIDGHSCETGGSGSDDARALGYCGSSQAWMMPVAVEWALRTSRILGHAGLGAWVVEHGARSAENHAVTGAGGLPDIGRSGGWRTVYRCSAGASGVVPGSCAKVNSGENNGGFYANGLVGYLNVFGLVLAADPSDPHRICDWLPAAYGARLAALGDLDINARVWGKSSGQAFGMSAEAVGAIAGCAR